VSALHAPYARLAELAEAERDLAVAGRIDELLAVQAERAALVARLPARAPEGARPWLARAAAAQVDATVALSAAVAAARAAVVRVERGRTAVAAYRPVAPVVPGVARRG
jgi:hypothetical protein